MRHIELISQADCCGCGICVEICHSNAITMQRDHEGFMYPTFDEITCFKCGACVNRCPIINSGNLKEDSTTPIFLGGYTKESEIRVQSSSGGIFGELAKNILSQGGIVVGATLEHHKVHHICISDLFQLDRLRGSKYVESSLLDVWSPLIEYLKQGKKVLFSGTPCQNAAAKRLLIKWKTQILFVEVVCMGVPSPLLFDLYLQWREKKKGTTKDFNFRYKIESGNTSQLRHIFNDRVEYYDIGRDPYMKAFYLKYSLRPSCYNCHFKNNSKNADITLGDFWGIEDLRPEFEAPKGVSLIICKSERGLEMMKEIEGEIYLEEFSQKEALLKNPMVQGSAIKPLERTHFFSDLDKTSIEKFFLERRLVETKSQKIYYTIRTYLGRLRRNIFHKYR